MYNTPVFMGTFSTRSFTFRGCFAAAALFFLPPFFRFVFLAVLLVVGFLFTVDLSWSSPMLGVSGGSTCSSLVLIATSLSVLSSSVFSLLGTLLACASILRSVSIVAEAATSSALFCCSLSLLIDEMLRVLAHICSASSTASSSAATLQSSSLIFAASAAAVAALLDLITTVRMRLPEPSARSTSHFNRRKYIWWNHFSSFPFSTSSLNATRHVFPASALDLRPFTVSTKSPMLSFDLPFVFI
mmetsp:Transcript_21012/g.32056  ORF Transcript_21012/g.32056 Transcript_21012/m.32056 type:complete len:243 (+) Transcript_21012:161-889(+)